MKENMHLDTSRAALKSSICLKNSTVAFQTIEKITKKNRSGIDCSNHQNSLYRKIKPKKKSGNS